MRLKLESITPTDGFPLCISTYSSVPDAVFVWTRREVAIIVSLAEFLAAAEKLKEEVGG